MKCELERAPGTGKDEVCRAHECARCGWNEKEHAERMELLRKNGFSMRYDGLRYLKIREIKR